MTEVTGRVGEQRPWRYPPYPDYKESGVQWLGEVPATWDIAPVYARYEVALGKMLDAKRVTGESPGKYLRNVDVQWDAVNIDGLPEMDFPPSDRNRYLLRPGDLLVCEGGEVGRTATWRGGLDECFYQKAIHRVRPWAACDSPRFFYFLMYAMAKRGVFTAGGNPNTIDHLTAVQLRRYRVPAPAASEQRAIVAFLDRKTAKIDALVARKKRLIELLQEKRTALITRAVTRGLDPNAPMKDSGVEWLGEIPTHWEVIPFGRLIACIEQGWSPVAEDRSAVEDEWGVIRLSAINKGEFRQDEHKTLPSGVLADARYEIREADFLLTRSNTPDLVGDVCVVGAVRGRLMLCDLVYRLDLVHEKVHRNFLAYWFLSRIGRHQIQVEARGSSQSMVKVSQGIIRAWTVVMPSLDEQRVVSVFLDRKTAGIDALIAKTQEAIDQLREFRTALIASAVTGKIDVREMREAMP